MPSKEELEEWLDKIGAKLDVLWSSFIQLAEIYHQAHGVDNGSSRSACKRKPASHAKRSRRHKATKPTDIPPLGI